MFLYKNTVVTVLKSGEYLEFLHEIVHFLSNRLSGHSKGTINVKKSDNFLRHFLVKIFDVTIILNLPQMMHESDVFESRAAIG